MRIIGTYYTFFKRVRACVIIDQDQANDPCIYAYIYYSMLLILKNSSSWTRWKADRESVETENLKCEKD